MSSDGSSLQILSSSQARAWGLIHPYRWVEPAKPELKPPFLVSSPSRALAEPQARPNTRSVRKTKIMQNSPMFSKNASDLIVFHPASLSFEILEKILLTLQQASGTVNYLHYKIVDWHFRKYYVLIKCMELTCFFGISHITNKFFGPKNMLFNDPLSENWAGKNCSYFSKQR